MTDIGEVAWDYRLPNRESMKKQERSDTFLPVTCRNDCFTYFIILFIVTAGQMVEAMLSNYRMVFVERFRARVRSCLFVKLKHAFIHYLVFDIQPLCVFY